MITKDTVSMLKEWGMEYEDTLHRFMNKEELLERFLRKFEADTSYLQLMEQLQAGNYGEAFAHAHTLKGVTANLGLEGLRRPASEITELLRHWETLPVDTERLVEEMDVLRQNRDKLQTILSLL
ncbi:MAG: Hpt domain-containing protein [Lachnospiraceae bacterium]|nr:Hpt domain-containing protein [Lachnospiraceae bacterium]